MSAVIGALRVDLGMNSASFKKGASDAERRVSRMRNQFAALSAAAAVAGAALAAAVKSGLGDIDRQAKAARSIDGTTTALRALEIAASDAGIRQGTLTTAAQNMSREIARAAREGGLGAKALDRLGLSASALGNLDADQRLAKIADRVKDLGLSSGQTMDALRDLGVRNREMALLFVQGGDAIRSARSEVEDLGLALDQNAVRKVEEANDALSRMSFAFESFRNQVAVKAAPALKKLADGFVASLKAGGVLRKLIDGLAQNMERIVVTVGVAVVAFGTNYVGAMVAAKVATLTFASALGTVKKAMIRTGIGALIVVAGELAARFLTLSENSGSAATATDNVTLAMGDEIRQSQKLNSLLAGDVTMSTQVAKKKLEEARARYKNVSAIIAEQRQLALSSDRYSSVLTEITHTQDALNATGFPAIDAAVRQKADAFEALQKRLAALRVEQQDILAGNRELSDQFDSTQKNILALEDAIAAAKDGVATFGDGLVEPIELTDRLDASLANLGGSSGRAVAALAGVETAVDNLKASFEGLLDRLAQGDVAGGFKGFFSDIKRQGSDAFAGLLKDAFNGGGLKAITGGLGKAMSGVASGISSLFSGGGLGALGGLISSALPIIGAVTGIVKLIEGFSSKEIIAKGVKIGVQGGGLSGGQFETEKRTSFWGLVSKTITRDTAFSKDQAKAFGAQIEGVKEAVRSTFELAGVEVSDAMIDGVNLAVRTLDLRGLDQAQIQQKITEVFANYGDAISRSIGNVSLKVAATLAQVKGFLEPAGQAFLGTFKQMATAANELAKIAGGTGQLGQKVQAFANLFLSDQEKLAAMNDAVAATFGRLHLAVPATNEEFKRLVMSQDLMTKSGRKAYNTLLDIAPVFDAASRSMGDLKKQFDLSGGNFISEFDARMAQIAAARGYDVTQSVYANAGQRQLGPLSDLNNSSEAQGRLLQRILNIFERWDVDGLEVRQ